MSNEIQTFTIPDIDGEEARASLSSFLRTVEVQRIDTAYAEGAWRILILYQDQRRKEETKQIESAIAAALRLWRDKASARDGVGREEVLPDEVLAEVAHFAPTTEIELATILQSKECVVGGYGVDIVHVVRQTLEELID